MKVVMTTRTCTEILEGKDDDIAAFEIVVGLWIQRKMQKMKGRWIERKKRKEGLLCAFKASSLFKYV